MYESPEYWLVTAVLIGFLLVLVSLPYCRLLAASYKMPGPFALPFIGNALSFLGTLPENFVYLTQLEKQYDHIVRIWLGPKLFVALLEPADVQLVLGDNTIRNRDSTMTTLLSQYLGNGLLANRDTEWKLHRKLITPAFHYNLLDSYVDIFGRNNNILIDKLEEMADGRTFDVYHRLSLCTLDSICETVLGTQVSMQEKGECELFDAVDKGLVLLHRRMVRPWLLYDWLYAMTRDGQNSRRLKQVGDSFSESIIASKLQEYRSSVQRASTPSLLQPPSGVKKVTTLLDVLIEASETQGSVLSPEEMRDEVMTIVLTAYDTSATAMACLLTLLGMHPHVQEQVIEEVEDIFGDDTRLPTSDDLTRLVVLERCIKETLRLFPVAALLPREISKDIKISRGHTLPAGCTAVVISYMLHRDPRNFPDPDAFTPDRWLPENSEGRHPFCYLPFSAGPRNCIGQKYAWLQMKTTVSSVFRRYRVTSDTTMEQLGSLELSVMLRSECGYKIQLHKK